MELSQGFWSQGENRQVCRLTKFLHGLNQAPRQRNTKLSQALTKCKFWQSQYDHSLCIKEIIDGIIIVIVYIDYILVTGDKMD